MNSSRKKEVFIDSCDGLRRDDLLRVIDGVNRLLACESVECLREAAVQTAAALMTSSSASWTEINMGTGYSHGCISTGEDPAVMSQAMSSVAHQHPVINAFMQTGDGSARAISDMISRRQFQSLDLYTRFFKKHRTEDQLSIAARVEGVWVLGLVVNRETWGFTAAEHSLLQSLRPTIISMYSKLRRIEELSTCSEGVNPQKASRACLVRALRARGLAPREAEVLAMVCEGLGNKAIAGELRISEGTVRKHIDRIFLKLGVNNRTAGARAALSLIHEGIVENN